MSTELSLFDGMYLGKTLDIRELRVSVWVFRNGKKEKIIALYYDEGVGTLSGVWSIKECVTPIPLSVDFLQKNGFSIVDKDFDGWQWWNKDVADRKVMVIYKDTHPEDETNWCNGHKVTYVHELQHVLFDGGIEMEVKV